ncbi:MAG: phospholipid carrier-dependent glycosyltransferase, partial [Bacillati bacterium ANGP1]
MQGHPFRAPERGERGIDAPDDRGAGGRQAGGGEGHADAPDPADVGGVARASTSWILTSTTGERGEAVQASPLRVWPLAALLILVLVRAALAARTPVIDDEGYYWLWSRHLNLSYLDHPPLVAWLDAIATSAGRTEWLLRVPAMAATLGTTLVLYGLGRDLFGAPAGLRAAALYVAVPVFALQAIHAIPDPLLYLWWAAAMWAFWRAVHGEPRMWWACGLALGLGVLSKYAALVLPVAMLG